MLAPGKPEFWQGLKSSYYWKQTVCLFTVIFKYPILKKFLDEWSWQIAGSILYWQYSLTAFNHLYCFCKNRDIHKRCKTLEKTCEGVHVLIAFLGYPFCCKFFLNKSVRSFYNLQICYEKSLYIPTTKVYQSTTIPVSYFSTGTTSKCL